MTPSPTRPERRPELDHVSLGQGGLCRKERRIQKGENGAVVGVSVDRRQAVHGHNHIQPPKCGAAAGVEHCTVRRGAGHDYRGDPFILDNLLKVGTQEFVRARQGHVVHPLAVPRL